MPDHQTNTCTRCGVPFEVPTWNAGLAATIAASRAAGRPTVAPELHGSSRRICDDCVRKADRAASAASAVPGQRCIVSARDLDTQSVIVLDCGDCHHAPWSVCGHHPRASVYDDHGNQVCTAYRPHVPWRRTRSLLRALGVGV